MEINTLKKDYVSGVYKTKSLLIREQAFDLKSGGKSHIYLNHNNFLIYSKYLSIVADLYALSIPAHVNTYSLGAVDSIMSPVIVGAIATRTQRDFVIIKSQKFEHGVKDDIFGDPKGEVILIDDMTSTGGTILEAALKIREKGGTVSYALVSAARDNKAKENLSKEGINLISLFTFDEILTLLNSQLTEQEHKIVLLEKERKCV